MSSFIEIVQGDKVIALYDAKHYSGVLYVPQDTTLNSLEVSGLQDRSRRALRAGNKEGEVLGIILNEDHTLTVVRLHITTKQEKEDFDG